jgi:hypothetical protein
MFKVPAESVEEYFRFDPEREHSLRELDALIRPAAPALSRWFVPGTPPGQPGMTMTLIGYGQYKCTVKSSPILVTWPVLGIALQKSYLSFYSNVYADGQNFIAGYAGKLGPARVSTKGVVTFATLGDIDRNALAAAIAEIAAGLQSGRLVAR